MWLTHHELRSLLAHARAVRERDFVLILVAYQHGLRASEAVGLTPGHFRHGKLTVNRLKHSEKTTQELPDPADELFDEHAAVKSWLSQHRARGLKETDPLFSKGPMRKPLTRYRFHQLVTQYGKAAGIDPDKCHAHALKHSLAHHMIASGIPLNYVQKRLGHKNLSSTGMYTKLTDADQDKEFRDKMGSRQKRIQF